MRDWLTEEIDSIIVDSPEEYEKDQGHCGESVAQGQGKIRRYEGELPVFEPLRSREANRGSFQTAGLP